MSVDDDDDDDNLSEPIKKMLGRQKCTNVHQMLKCNQSSISGLNSNQHSFLYQAFRNLLMDGINTWMNLDDMLNTERLILTFKCATFVCCAFSLRSICLTSE